MVYIKGSRAKRSAGKILDTSPVASDLDCILRDRSNSSFHTVFAHPGLTNQNVLNKVRTLSHAPESKDESPPSVLVHVHHPTPTPPKSVSRNLDNAKLRTMMRQLGHKEAKRTYSRSVKETMTKVAGKRHSEAF